MSDEYEEGPDSTLLASATEAWLNGLDLESEQVPIAALARTLARQIDAGVTAAAAQEYRRTVEALTPRTDRLRTTEGNRADLLGDER